MASVVVNVAELKNRLSHYLREVRNGGSVLVRDRHRVIARIEPAGGSSVATTDDMTWLDELEHRGTIRRGKGALPRGWHSRRTEIDADVVGALLAERDEAR
jgi:antitoxin (DNA-binding transcriptional repressor) of toxin-antitoxin stability system